MPKEAHAMHKNNLITGRHIDASNNNHQTYVIGSLSVAHIVGFLCLDRVLYVLGYVLHACFPFYVSDVACLSCLRCDVAISGASVHSGFAPFFV